MTTTAIRHIDVANKENYYIQVESENKKIKHIIPCAKKLVEAIETIAKSEAKEPKK